MVRKVVIFRLFYGPVFLVADYIVTCPDNVLFSRARTRVACELTRCCFLTLAAQSWNLARSYARLRLSMEPAKVLQEKPDDMSVDEAHGLLLSAASSSYSYLPPVKPKGGEVYLFSPGSSPKKRGKTHVVVMSH